MQAGTALAQQPSAPTSSPDTDKDTDLARKRRLFRAFEENKRREIDEQKEARRYYAGRQWTEAEKAVLARRNQPDIWDNRIGRKIDFLVGVEQRMRRDPKAFGRGPSDQKSADVATASLRFVCDLNRWDVMASDAAHDGMVAGIGVAWIGIESGGRGLDVKCKRGQNDRFFYDPRSTLPDFSDARYMGMHLWLDVDDVTAEHPDKAGDVESMFDRDAGTTHLDEDRHQQWADFESRRVRVIELYERKHTPRGPAWYFCKFSGGIVLESMWSPYLDEYGNPDCPYVAWSPYIDERGDRYGVVRNMRPMQDEINKRRSRLLHLLNARTIHAQKGTLEDVDAARDELAKADGIIEHNGEWGTTVGIVDNTVEIRGQADLLAQAQAALENLGPNPGLIGKGGGVADQSGRAILAQRDSGMTELSPVFERLRDWKLRCYRKMWARIRQAWTGERYIRVTEDPRAPTYLGINQYGMGPDGTITQQNVIAEIDVDVILDEGPDTIVMQEELMQTLSQLGEAAVGPLGRVMIELSQVANKDQLLAMMDKAQAPDPAVAEIQKRMAKLEELLAAANVDEKIASVEAKRAETLSKLMTAFTPPTQPVDKVTGMPSGTPPQPPDFASAMQAMQAFPLHYGQPTAMQMAASAPEPQQPGQEQGQGEMMPTDAGMMQGGGMPMMPGDMQDMPLDQMPGGLPVDGELASQMSAGGMQGG